MVYGERIPGIKTLVMHRNEKFMQIGGIGEKIFGNTFVGL